MLQQFIELFLHLDQTLTQVSQIMGPWLYILLFAVIFAETGLIVFPFLPGDSLLFAVGALCALPESGLDLALTWILLTSAAILGDNVNYLIGRKVGPQIFSRQKSLLFNPAYLRRAQDFYEKHGSRTVFLARFLPILRTFAPFIAGIALMKRKIFVLTSISGSMVWMSLFLGAGYFFGNIPWVQKNFIILMMAIIVISLLPAVISAFRWQKDTPRGA